MKNEIYVIGLILLTGGLDYKLRSWGADWPIVAIVTGIVFLGSLGILRQRN